MIFGKKRTEGESSDAPGRRERRKKSGRMPSGAGSDGFLTVDSPQGWPIGEKNGMIGSSAALKISAVYGAVQYICDFASALPVYVYDRHTRGRIEQHHLSNLLRLRPNEAQTPSDFNRFLMRSLLLRGNGYAYNYRDPHSGRVIERIPLFVDSVRVEIIDGHLRYFYTHPTTGELYCLSPQDVTHYKMDSNNIYEGVSVLKYAAQTLLRAQAASEYETAVYRNNARPGGILETEADLGGLSDVPDPKDPSRLLTRKENIRRAWDRAHGGSANAFQVAVLDNGLKYTPIKIDAYDASFVRSKDVSIADIARFFGVPLHALMTGSQSYASNEQNSLEFVQGRGLAIVRMMEEEDSYKLLLDSELEKGLWIKRNLDGRLRGDTAARANFYRTMHDIGAYSVNDILALEDKEDVLGGDVRLASLNYVPLDKFEEISAARNMNKEVEQ